ncbi:chromosome segregation protein SMC [Immundisolibacter sp.]|uniref:chromosome segregation protein SMC n=1 Tax=Immundisolibacter sp. TaxID=1934948 RepID=UPI0035621170
MKLKSIRLAGFKTFVDPTLLHLRGALIGVVGPNGCGKSNVVDAVRWVLGESSARQLRGDALADVIFNGSSARQPVSKASVELVFDNVDGSLGGPWAAYAEIAVRRELTREGQSVYYLNGSRCRRRDITDIFLGTGLGPRSYAIIEQGMIARLIEARPEELRAYIEEVAGISKYKERRQETEGRIRHTRDNMARLEDLREELAQRLGSLERQVRTAEKFRDLKTSERRARSQLFGARLRDLAAAAALRRADVERCATAQEQALAAVRAAEAQIEAAREAQRQATAVFGERQQAYYQTSAEVARCEQALLALREQRERLVQELARLDASAEQIDHHCVQTLARLEQLATTQQAAEGDQQRLSAELQQAASAVARAETDLTEARQAHDVAVAAVGAAVQHQRLEQERARRLQEQLARGHERGQRLLREQQELGRVADADGADLLAQLAQLSERATAAERALTAVEAQITSCRTDVHEVTAQFAEVQTQVREQRARLTALETLQQGGLADAGQGESWLAERHIAAQALVAGIDADEAWHTALEAALGPWVGAQVVASLDALPVAELAQAPSMLLLEAQSDGPIPDSGLLETVRSAQDLGALIGGVRRADGIAAALLARHSLSPHESLVTTSGLRVGRNWLAIPATGGSSGVLERNAQIAALQANLGQAEQDLAVLETRRAEAQTRLADAERLRGESREQHSACLRQLGDLQARQAAAQAHRERSQARHVAIANELGELQTQSTQDAADLAAAQTAGQTAVRQQASLADQRARSELALRQAEAALRAARAGHEQTREQTHDLRLRAQAWQTEVATLQTTYAGWIAQRDSIGERRQALEREEGTASVPQHSLEQDLQARLGEREAASGQLGAAREAVAGADHQLRELDQARLVAERALQERRAELEARRLELTEVETRHAALAEQAVEIAPDIEQLLAELPDQADERQLERELADLAQRIERLGPINLAAIDEQREVAERKAYLDAQQADLASALETMEQAMRRMDRETRARFKDTFEQVDNGFKAAFPRLFGGGEACLEMLGEDVLETGVRIVARPPGKRNSSIHLLSGGEKALTAIALVFALFELNPAPFCMLDEVDAPLDDHNVGRFCALVQEMSARVQFLLITHNKTTMEMVGQLTGVTMAEPGVSRLVVVDVNEAVALAGV